MHNFCTYFDSNYLDRGIAVWRSLQEHCPGAHLYVCCLDDKTFNVLRHLSPPTLSPFLLRDLEAAYPDLLVSKSSRTKVEYYFTLTPSLVRFVLQQQTNVEEVTYIDSDLLFFSSPEPLFDEMRRSGASVAIIAHRFTSALQHLILYGVYNVGWVTFKRTEEGLACLLDWQQRCIDWCYDHVDGDRFADQKYLDKWPTDFKGVVVLNHPGANVALWNIEPGTITKSGRCIEVYNRPLIFYHFHGLSQITKSLFFTNSKMYKVELDWVILKEIYGKYILILKTLQRELRNVEIHPLLRYKHSQEDIEASMKHKSDSNFLLAVMSCTFRPPALYWRWAQWHDRTDKASN